MAAFNIGDRVRFKNLGRTHRRAVFPPPASGSPYVNEGDEGTVVYLPDEGRVAVRPDGKLHAHGENAGWVFRPEELEIISAESGS